VTKFPAPPGVEALRQIAAETLDLPAGTPLARIYFSAGPYPSHWNRFRHVGPTAVRWDHHLPSSSDEPTEQDRAVLYCAPRWTPARRKSFRQPAGLTGSATHLPSRSLPCRCPVTLLDLRGAFATRIGTSTAIHSGPRSRARAWARQLYDAYPEVQGFQYGSSMNGHAPAIVLNERAKGALPKEPQFHRALNDDMLVDVLQQIAQRLSYGLR
jgi:hypothetical protein